MTIFWTFYNTPDDKRYFQAELEPSVADHLFEFNLGVLQNDGRARVLPSYVLGRNAHGLKIRGESGEVLLILIKDKNGTKKRFKYAADIFWVSSGDMGSVQNILEYRRHFEESLGLSEEAICCEALFDEYKRLEAATHREAQVGRPGQSYAVKHISPQDLLIKKSIAKELVSKCENHFKEKPGEWFKIKKSAE